MRIALCDDNQDFLQNTANLIRQWATESGITAELFPFDNGDAAPSSRKIGSENSIGLPVGVFS